MRTRIVVGSRGSKLALIQTESVMAKIREVNPHVGMSLSKIATAGDRDRRTLLDRMGVAIFVKELEKALLDGMIASPDGQRMLRASGEDNNNSPEELGVRMAQKMLGMGASGFIAEVSGK